jgi:hypothetical protein
MLLRIFSSDLLLNSAVSDKYVFLNSCRFTIFQGICFALRRARISASNGNQGYVGLYAAFIHEFNASFPNYVGLRVVFE